MLQMGLQNLKGCSRVMLNDIKVDLKPMILLKREALIIMVWVVHFELELHQKDVKNNFFRLRILRRRCTKDNLKVLLKTVRKLAN